MLHISETENVLIKECMRAKQEKRKFYIYGTGMAGKMAYMALQSLGISIEGFCVDAQYCRQEMNCMGKKVVSFEEVERMAENGSRTAVFIAFMSAQRRLFKGSEFIKMIEGDFCSFGVSPSIIEEGRIDRAFVDMNSDCFQELYQILEDEKSRQILSAYLNQKISGKLEYLENLYGEEQYFEKGLVHLGGVECMIDCGAYDGDSYRNFCSSYQSDVGKKYQGTAFLLEPDQNNFLNLQKQYGGQKNMILVKKGAWDKKDTLWFDGNNTTASSISQHGANSIEVDSIDHIVSQQGGGRRWIL